MRAVHTRKEPEKTGKLFLSAPGKDRKRPFRGFRFFPAWKAGREVERITRATVAHIPHFGEIA